MALGIVLRDNFAHQKIHETARPLVSRCTVMFSHEIFFTNRHDKLSNARNQVRRAPACHFVDYLVSILRLRACRFLILIISLIRENWALNFGKMKNPG